jgi:DNA-binding NarL/FixJ family response regulator
MSKLRILVVDDHPLMREALCMAIDDQPDMMIVGVAADGWEALAQYRSLRPDITIMDLYLPGQDGITTIAQILAEDPGARCLALTSSTDETHFMAAIQAGALGYLQKDAQRSDLLLALRTLGHDHAYVPAHFVRKLVDCVRQSQPARAVHEPLTIRELDVLRLIGTGAGNHAIAEALSLSEGTVRVHIHNILAKLDLASREQALTYAQRSGLTGGLSL